MDPPAGGGGVGKDGGGKVILFELRRRLKSHQTRPISPSPAKA